MPGSLGHLTRRFFDVVTSMPLDAAEQAAVETWLTKELQVLFFDQQPADQRHGYNAALKVITADLEDSDAVTAALMHDVGKRHARLGVLGRSVASVLILAGLPLSERMIAYRDHGILGARDLAAAGAPSMAIEFAMYHHGPRPLTFDEHTWEVLEQADQPQRSGPDANRR